MKKHDASEFTYSIAQWKYRVVLKEEDLAIWCLIVKNTFFYKQIDRQAGGGKKLIKNEAVTCNDHISYVT